MQLQREPWDLDARRVQHDLDALPQISIILPCHNSSKFLGETLRSVEDQTYDSWELICVDDGSVDGTLLMLDACQERLGGGKVKIVRNTEPAGAALARNQAIEIAQGRYIAFIDSDDVWHPEKLERQIAFMQKGHLVFSYTGYRKIDPASRKSRKYFPAATSLTIDDLLNSNQIRCASVMFDAGTIGKAYMRPIKLRNDLLLWVDLLHRISDSETKSERPLLGALRHRSPRVMGLNEELTYYRVHSAGLSRNKLRAARYQWRTYRSELGLSIFRSIRYFASYSIRGYLNFVTW